MAANASLARPSRLSALMRPMSASGMIWRKGDRAIEELERALVFLECERHVADRRGHRRPARPPLERDAEQALRLLNLPSALRDLGQPVRDLHVAGCCSSRAVSGSDSGPEQVAARYPTIGVSRSCGSGPSSVSRDRSSRLPLCVQ